MVNSSTKFRKNKQSRALPGKVVRSRWRSLFDWVIDISSKSSIGRKQQLVKFRNSVVIPNKAELTNSDHLFYFSILCGCLGARRILRVNQCLQLFLLFRIIVTWYNLLIVRKKIELSFLTKSCFRRTEDSRSITNLNNKVQNGHHSAIFSLANNELNSSPRY